MRCCLCEKDSTVLPADCEELLPNSVDPVAAQTSHHLDGTAPCFIFGGRPNHVNQLKEYRKSKGLRTSDQYAEDIVTFAYILREKFQDYTNELEYGPCRETIYLALGYKYQIPLADDLDWMLVKVMEIEFNEEQLNQFHTLCSNQRDGLLTDTKAGCFFCEKTFTPSEIKEWCRSGFKGSPLNDAICPCCGIDSVIGEKLLREKFHLPLDANFLKQMNNYFFGVCRPDTLPPTDDAETMFED